MEERPHIVSCFALLQLCPAIEKLLYYNMPEAFAHTDQTPAQKAKLWTD